MAQASIEDILNELAGSSSATVLTRNDDPLTVALRREGTLNLDDLVRLHQARSLANNISASAGSASTTVFSSREASTATKPTSDGTNYPSYDLKGKGKAVSIYASSLSATHGSGSEAELERESSQRNDLLGAGSWMYDNLASKQVLRDATRSKRRTSRRSVLRNKKPIVVLHQDVLRRVSNDIATVAPPSCCDGRTHHCHCQSQLSHMHSGAVEQGTYQSGPQANMADTSLSRTRCYILACLVVLIALTICLSAMGVGYTGKNHVPRTKMIVFAAVVVTSLCTGLAMGVAKRALQEALLAGISMLVVGFALLVQLDDLIPSF